MTVANQKKLDRKSLDDIVDKFAVVFLAVEIPDGSVDVLYVVSPEYVAIILYIIPLRSAGTDQVYVFVRL